MDLYREANEKGLKHSLSSLLPFNLRDIVLNFFQLLFLSLNPLCLLTFSPGVIHQTAGTPLLFCPTHTFTFSRSGWDDSFISSLDPPPPPPPPFSLHSPPFAELPPYRGICVGVDEGSFCSVQGHLHQRKSVSQGLPVSLSPSWHSNCSCPSSPNASCFTRAHSHRAASEQYH